MFGLTFLILPSLKVFNLANKPTLTFPIISLPLTLPQVTIRAYLLDLSFEQISTCIKAFHFCVILYFMTLILSNLVFVDILKARPKCKHLVYPSCQWI